MTSSDADLYRAVPQHDFVSKISDHFESARKNIPHYEVVWWFFVACIALGNIRSLAGEVSGPAYYVFAFGGSAGCAWAWLFSRTLFRPNAPLAPWPIAILGVTVLTEGLWEITSGFSATGVAGETKRLIANAASYVCISLLALVFVEAFNGFNKGMSVVERRFRLLFTGLFAAALSVTLLWAWNAPEGSLAARSETLTHLVFGLLAVIGGRLAIGFRKKNPISLTPRRQKPRRWVSDDTNANLAERIRDALQREQFFATPKLKVSNLSEVLGEPEYKVTQCITGIMGYQNFNRLVNDYRIANAKAALEHPGNKDKQVLSIALECGFNSIGPFNRAFKEEVGMTPREYRAGQV